MSRRVTVALLALGLMGACAEGHPSSHFEKLQAERILEPFGLTATVADTSVAFLAWHAPETDCAQAYQLSVSYEPGLKFEEDNEGGLIIARHRRQRPYRKRRGDGTRGVKTKLPDGPVPRDVVVPGELFYRGYRAERIGATRNFHMSSEFVGPASPMAGCFWRTWDPMEDAFALGWPKLPGRLTAVGEQWNGLRVEAQCSRAACVDPVTGGGGPDNHFRPCVTRPLRETLAGVYEIGGERFALIRSHWDAGHEGKGISSTRTALISVDHGRPVWSEFVVDHRFAQPTVNGKMEPIVRTWQMTAVDRCPGSLASLGWDRPEQMTDLLDMLREGLESGLDSRKGRTKKGEREDKAVE
ncbi:MAG: hypothetical protein JKY37_01855 [Nannocystaceae bacterium]|nr:hypothetical protein [Nannocystaceae bacterium]